MEENLIISSSSIKVDQVVAIQASKELAVRDNEKHRIVFRRRLIEIDSLIRSIWNQTGSKQLERAEANVLSIVKTHFHGRFVSILNKTVHIWTISLNLTSKNVPIVLVHGYGGGLALWSLILDQLASHRPVYALDLPGFGRSSRPRFSRDSIEAEKHFGGFLSASYALSYPKYVKQLVLIDPWGIGHKPEYIWQTGRLQKVPVWLRLFSSIMMKISPLTGLRAAGPFGISIIKYFRADLQEKFEKFFDDDRILIYLYHCNAQLPTGEQAFHTMSDCFAWAKEPMIDRIHLIDSDIPIYFLHGERSWLTVEPSLIAQERRPNIFVETIKDAAHHIYADAHEEFNMYLKRVLFNQI